MCNQDQLVHSKTQKGLHVHVKMINLQHAGEKDLTGPGIRTRDILLTIQTL